jgi:hypothetical protein
MYDDNNTIYSYVIAKQMYETNVSLWNKRELISSITWKMHISWSVYVCIRMKYIHTNAYICKCMYIYAYAVCLCVCVRARVGVRKRTHIHTNSKRLTRWHGVRLYARGMECGICGTFHEPRARAATRRSPSGSRSWGLRTPSAPPTPIINVW